MSEQNQEKKSKKGFFMFGKKPENYDWDIKKERERTVELSTALILQ